MRLLLVLLLWTVIFGAVGGYLRFARYAQEQIAARSTLAERPPAAEGKFALEVTTTFDAGVDAAFALDPTESTAVRVQFLGRDLLVRKEPVAAGTPLRVDPVPGVAPGVNEFFVEAQPSQAGLGVAHAVRVRVFRDELPVADQTLWSDPGLPVQGVVRIDIPAAVSHEATHAPQP